MSANPEQSGEAVLVVSYSCICCATSESGVCLFSLTPDMLPGWMDGKLTSWFPYTLPVCKGILHPVIQGHVTCFFLLTTPVMQLEASRPCKQMN